MLEMLHIVYYVSNTTQQLGGNVNVMYMSESIL